MLFLSIIYLYIFLLIFHITFIIPSNHLEILYYFCVFVFYYYFLYVFCVFLTKSAFLNHLHLSLFDLFIYHVFYLYFSIIWYLIYHNYHMYFYNNLFLLKDEIYFIIFNFVKIYIIYRYSLFITFFIKIPI